MEAESVKRVCLERGGKHQRLEAANLINELEIGPNLTININKKKRIESSKYLRNFGQAALLKSF